MQNIILLIFF